MDKEMIVELANSVNDVVAATSRPLNLQIANLKAELEKHRWIPVSDMPDNLLELPVPDETAWKTKYYTLEDCAEIPRIMTAAEIWLDEGSEVEYWKPIVLPE